MLLTSEAIHEGEMIDVVYAEPAAGGENRIPDLSWIDAPEGTKSFAVTVYDPDAPTGSGFWHWIAFDIPVHIASLPVNGGVPEGAREWENDYGYAGYGGPCPPKGRIHRYQFSIHALNTEKLEVPEAATHAQVRAALLAAQIELATLTGKFQLPERA